MNEEINEDLNDNIKWAFAEIQGSSAYSLERDRPYDGQAHTHVGERGKRLVEGLTMRDISDCIVNAFLSCAHMERACPIRDDLYQIPDLNELDPGAVISNTVCNMEKMMGIYPNVPGLEQEL